MTALANPTVSRRKTTVAQNFSRHRHNGHPDGTGRDEFMTWLTASCQRQDVPVIITDPTALAAIATLLR
jgi:hypothetical protein